ncbi:hypothetical protein GGR57DRAFT_514851 [Xylariaceae sp. FL1272]|nr:hypothetical protein GGR57DRAFT_514851 [Xylariaceae sp. FL1272]
MPVPLSTSAASDAHRATAAGESPADLISYLSQIQPSTDDSTAQNVDLPSVAVNGSAEGVDNEIADIVDDLVNSAEASVNGGSDTEASSKPDGKLPGEKGHMRSSSVVKKPQSFKSVSVNRTFLAPKTAPNAASRPDSAAGSPTATPQTTFAPSASRLKLVAKSGSNLGGASKTLSTNGKPLGAPDGNTVWNRNRVPAPQEVKKRSDEELQNDGIHMAARLTTEDMAKNQSNWADIEEDEDWAPEAITWTDGTKITLPQADEMAPSPVTQPAALAKDPNPVSKPKSPAPVLASPPTTVAPSPSTRPSGMKGLVLKGAPEKPTLVAKPTPPSGPAKSPWAALPPVEKVSPVVMEIPSQQAPPRYPLRDASNIKGATPPPPSTKEIAADDFNRYRDSSANPNRELFNSQSGRYEPVSDRRGSRSEVNGRQPAVLQRPSHNEQQGPAEPSSAFQTSRTTGQEGPYGRRRGSSNVSGGSGNWAHRMGGKSHDLGMSSELVFPQEQLPQPRVGSMSSDSPIMSHANQLPNTLPNQRPIPSHPYQSHLSPHQTYATAQHTVHPQDAVDTEAIENTQKEFMKKRREEAVRRRMEEEAREEEAKQARIAEKLKALGPAPERKSAKKEQPSAVTRTEIPASLALRPKATADLSPTNKPEPKGDKTPFATEAVLPEVSEAGSSPVPLPDPRINGSAQRQFSQEPARMSAQVVAASGSQPAPSWPEAHSQSERFQQSWPSGHQNGPRNVWASPGSSLGNGTFNADIGAVPEAHPTPTTAPNSTMATHHPAPIGPPRSSHSGHSSHISRAQPQPSRIAPIGPPRGANPWAAFDAKADDEARRVDRLKESDPLDDNRAPGFNDKWRPVDLNDSGRRTLNKSQGSDVPKEVSAQDLRPESKPVSRLDMARQAPVGNPNMMPPTGPAAQTRSGSRFFPPSSKDILHEEASPQHSPRTKSPTPPPPTSDGHPAYDGDASRPHVALPPHKPIVKLPPSAQPTMTGPIAPPARQAPVSFAAAAASNAASRSSELTVAGRPVSRGRGFNGIPQKPHEIASQENWQSKINNLMGKKSTSPAKPAPLGAGMLPIEFPRSHDSTDVPILSPSGTDSTEDSSYTSREMAEECFGEQEMGSLPVVQLPTKTPEAAWQAVTINWNPLTKWMRVVSTAGEPLKFFYDEDSDRNRVIRISAPGMSDPKTIPIPNGRSGSNPRRSVPRGGSARHSSNRGGRRNGRDDNGEPTSAPSSIRTASGRGRGYRPRPDTWGRQAASTAQS